MEGMTTDGPIETLPEPRMVRRRSEVYIDPLRPIKEMFSKIRGKHKYRFEAPECDELTRICSKLLQEYKQALSNNATADDWLISIENYVDDTTDKPRIQRIPSLLREKQSNKNCYDPLVISIGPYHHGKPGLEAFEQLKIPIAQKFVRFFTDQVSIEQLHKEVAKIGKSARECYEKDSTEKYDDELFNKMMFLDACFVLYFIIYIFLITKRTNIKQKEADPLHGWICYLGFVRRDLLFLENQIPLLALKVMMKLLFKSEKREWERELLQNFLDHKAIMPPQENSCNNAVKKFLAQMMGRSVQKKEIWKLDMDARSPAPLHLLHLFREQLIGSSPEDKNKCSLNLDREQLIGSSAEDKNNLIRSSPQDKNEKKSVKRLGHPKDIGSSPEDKNKKKPVKFRLNPDREQLVASSSEDQKKLIVSSPEDKNKLIGSSSQDKNKKKSVKRLRHPKDIGSSPEDKNKKKPVKCLLNPDREQLIGLSPEDKNKKKLVKCPLSPDREHLIGTSPEDINKLIGSSPEDKNNENFEWHSYRSVTELKAAVIHFRPSQTNHVTDVKFKSHLISSTLTYPRIVVDDSTQDLLLNLAAYEMCPHGPSDYHIMSYICLMDSFIDHADDVKRAPEKKNSCQQFRQ